jgi:hypothetical protein
MNEREQRRLASLQKIVERRNRLAASSASAKHEQKESKSSITKIYERNKINYAELKEKCEFNLTNTDEVDVSIIIPVMGRENFNKPMVEHLLEAMDFLKEKTYSITFVEHSEEPSHKMLCNGKTNHIWIKKTNKDFFNKCLAMNIGAFFSNKAKYYLFHDIDLLVKKDFFHSIFENLSKSNTSALQAFSGRRVVVMSKELTDLILTHKLKIDDFEPGGTLAPYSAAGAPGGSIFINREDFYKVGGFDAELFHSYSCEDAFFYHKVEIMTGIKSCDNPVIEVFHMDHPRTNGSGNPDIRLQRGIYAGFKDLPINEKKIFIENISKNLKIN